MVSHCQKEGVKIEHLIRVCFIIVHNYIVSTAIECPVLENPAEGYLIGSDRGYGQTIRFECNEGYTPAGPDTATCQLDKTWTNQPFVCQGKWVYYPNTPTFSTTFAMAVLKHSEIPNYGVQRNTCNLHSFIKLPSSV